jgi:hydroxymethylbilane synthase
MKRKLRIGSRGSSLAIAQSEWVAGQLAQIDSGMDVEFLRIKTAGDIHSQASNSRATDGKGIFVKEIEDALLGGEIDLAVHSLKDMPRDLPQGLCLGAFPKREDNRDAVVSRQSIGLNDLPSGSVIGTGSPRRRAQIGYRFKDKNFQFKSITGNVETRLKKLDDGQYDVIILAYAGLKRLHLNHRAAQILETEEMLPAPGQGCLGLEIRAGDRETAKMLERIKDEPSDLTARAERAFLLRLEGDCFIPLGASAKLGGENIHMQAILLSPDGGIAVETKTTGTKSDPEAVGVRLAEQLLVEGGAEILRELRLNF